MYVLFYTFLNLHMENFVYLYFRFFLEIKFSSLEESSEAMFDHLLALGTFPLLMFAFFLVFFSFSLFSVGVVLFGVGYFSRFWKCKHNENTVLLIWLPLSPKWGKLANYAYAPSLLLRLNVPQQSSGLPRILHFSSTVLG